jgi:hypothetical protein
MGFHFAKLLMYDQSLKTRSAAVRESLLSEMARLSSTIVQLAMDTSDDRTRHLSDHIYHMITFAAVTLCRLLHMYETQLATTNNIMELDSQIVQLASWLRSIGLPCHVASTLGDVVAAFHRKLRPNEHARYQRESAAIQTPSTDFNISFPDLLGMEPFDVQIQNWLPDWEPFQF